jgi:hypothetical protein
MVTDHEGELYDFGDIARANGATINHLEGARHAELVTREIVLANKLLVDEGKPRSATVNQRVCFNFLPLIKQRTINNQMSAV